MNAPLAERAVCTHPHDAHPREAHANDLPWKAIAAPGAKGVAPGVGREPPDPDWQPL